MIKDIILRRFISKIDIKTDDECWPWIAAKDEDGYGRFQLFDVWAGAHRIAYFLRHKELPLHNTRGDKLLVCHHCDNRPCCNPAHLFLGTAKDNMQDSIRKNRRADMRGSNNPSSCLSEAQVIKIRELAAKKTPYKTITNLYGIQKATISQIVTRKLWTHI